MKVAVALAPLIEKVGELSEGFSKLPSSAKGALAGGGIGLAVGGPIGALVGGAVGALVGGGDAPEKMDAGLGDGLKKAFAAPKKEDDKSPVTSLQKVGGGGGFGGADPQLTEQRTHTRLLQQIAAGVSKAQPSPPAAAVPV